MFWSTRPFVRILFFFIPGIFMAYYFPVFQTLNKFIYLGLILSLLVLSILFLWQKKWSLRWVSGLSIGLIIFTLAMFLTTIHYEELPQLPQSEKSFFVADIVNDPVPSEHSLKTILQIQNMLDSSGAYTGKLMVMAYFSKDSLSDKLVYGDRLSFVGTIRNPDGPKNPGEFDYKEFLRINGIQHVTFIPKGSWVLLGSTNRNPFFSIAGKARRYLLKALSENNLDDRNYAVAAAILLGYDNLMDPELEQNFVSAGAMHILCVSGLHVGVVYLVINFLLGFMKKSQFQVWLKALILLLFIWSYALLTGLAPSVQRASVMISILIVGNALGRGRDSFNTLAVSAVLLLVFDPLLLFNVGFQLSYSAVIGILFFYQPIYRKFYTKNYILDKIWSVSVISLAAQLGTFPLAAHYFHFFPTYFWLTNILIFPLSFVIIGLGMLFISISWLPVIPAVVGYGLSGVLFVLNELVEAVRSLPFSGLNNLYFPWIKVAIVYLLIIFIFKMIIQKNIRYLLPAVISLLILISIATVHHYNLSMQHQLVVYSINKHTAIDFIKGRNHVFLADSLLLDNASKQNYYLKNSKISWGLAEANYTMKSAIDNPDLGFEYDGDFGVFDSFKFVVIDGSRDYYPGSFDKQNLDAVFISGSKWLDLESISECFLFELLVIDSSVPAWKRSKLQDKAEKLGIQYYIVSEQGAFIKKL